MLLLHGLLHWAGLGGARDEEDLVIQMTTMATWIREDEKLVLSSHQSCQDCGKFSRCKFEEFEGFEVDTNDKIIAVEIKALQSDHTTS